MNALEQVEAMSPARRRAMLRAAAELVAWYAHYETEHGDGLITQADLMSIALGQAISWLHMSGMPKAKIVELVTSLLDVDLDEVKAALSLGPQGVVR